MSDPLDLNAIRERAKNATPGPWTPTYGRYNDLHLGDCGDASGVDIKGEHGFFVPGFSPENAEFIAHARDDVPALIAEVERLRDLARGLRRAIPRVWLTDDANARLDAAAVEVLEANTKDGQ